MRATQDRVAQFVKEHGLDAPAHARLLDLTSELGEVAKEFLTSSQYGGKEFKRTDAWCDELGDVLFSLVCLANATGVDLEVALSQALDKYAQRLASRGDAASGA